MKSSAIPSIFDFNNNGRQCDETPRSKRQRLRESQKKSSSATLFVMDEEIDVQHEVEVGESSSEISVSDNTDHQAPQPIHREVKCSMQTLDTYSIEHFQNNCRMIQYCTGFNNYEHFQLFFNILGPAAYELKYNCQLLTPENQLFLILMKLKQAKDDVKLALFFFFGISESTVSKLVRT